MLRYALPNFRAKTKCQPLLGGRVVPDATSGVFLLTTSSVTIHGIWPGLLSMHSSFVSMATVYFLKVTYPDQDNRTSGRKK